MKVRTLKVGTLEIPLDELDADVLEVGILRIIRGDKTAEFTVSSSSPNVAGRIVYELNNSSFPPNRYVYPGGPAAEAQGTAVLSVLSDGTGKLTTSVEGLKRLDTEAGFYQGWLIHDLTVPEDLSEEDFALIPHGPDGQGNRRGAIYTMNGRPPTIGRCDVHQHNTVWIPVSTGTFNTDDEGRQKARWDFTSSTNWSFSLLELLGIPVRQDDRQERPRDPDDPGEARIRLIPSGIARNIMTDLLMRPASVHSELELEQGFGQRLLAIYSDHISRYDIDEDGGLLCDDVTSSPECFIPPQEFHRMAITREINEGWLAPRFLFSSRAWVLAGSRT